MYARVKRLRERGKRISDREIGAAQPVAGELRIFGLSSSTVASITDPNSQVGEPSLPILHEARVTTMHGAGMLLKGEERPEGETGPAYVQEWSVRLD